MIPFKFLKKNIVLHQFIVIMFIFSLIFSLYYTIKSNNSFNYYVYDVIVLEKEPVIHYTICSLFYIIVLVIASSSYLGLPIISLSVTYRFLLIIYSLFHIQNFTLFNILAYILPQVMIELIITYMMTYMALQLTMQTLKIAFFYKENYNLKVLLNYVLTYILLVIILIFISCLFKIYLL